MVDRQCAGMDQTSDGYDGGYGRCRVCGRRLRITISGYPYSHQARKGGLTRS